MNLIELIEDYGYQLQEKGLEGWMSCPFHEDSNPSFSVSPTDDGYVWYCFSCKSGGGPIQFIQNIEKIDPMQAKHRWDKLNGREIKTDPMKESLTAKIEGLRVSDELYSFMAERNIKPETVDKFRIKWDDHIVYPFYDYDGVVKVHTRSLDGKEYRGSKPNMLWGMDHIPYGAEKVWVVEGFHDVMALDQLGVSAVSMSGTNFHAEYWEQLKDHKIQNVVFCPDGDLAGREFLKRLMFQGWPSECNIYFIELPEGVDPDDLQKLDFEEQLPLIWYVKTYWGTEFDINKSVAMYNDISKFVSRMTAAERSMIYPWFEKHVGSDTIYYLHGEVKPDLVAEEICIGNCIYSQSVRVETLSVLTEDCFHTKSLRNQFLFVRENDTVTPELFSSMFGGSIPKYDINNYKAYIDRVFNIRSKEKIIKSMDKARSSLKDDPSDMVGSLVEELYSFLDSDSLIHSSTEVTKRVMMEVNEKVKDPNVVGVSMNEDKFPILNRALLGYVKNKLIFISGLTGHGKTNVACNLIDDLIFDKNQNVLFVSLEMTPEELIQRQLTIRSGVSATKIITGSLEQAEYDHLIENAKSIMNGKLRILYGTYNLHKLIGIIRAQILRYKIRVIFIDYLQLISVDNSKARWEQLMEITKLLKTKICPLGVTVIALSQLNRSAMNSEVPEAYAQAGSYNMLADPDVAITIKKRQPEDGSNFLFFVDKHRYGMDQILVNGIFDRQTLRIKEAG